MRSRALLFLLATTMGSSGLGANASTQAARAGRERQDSQPRTAAPALHVPVEYFTLDNGLRAVL